MNFYASFKKGLKEATDEEYERYMANEKELAEQYYQRLCGNITDEHRNKFSALKEILNGDGEKELVDGFYIPVDFVNSISGEGHHLNSSMDLTISDLYALIDDNDSVESALKNLFDEYKADSAFSWGDNFLYALTNANIGSVNESELVEADNSVKHYNLMGDDVVLDIPNKTMTINGRTFPFERMDEFVKMSKGANRIHKPMSLLLYIDYKNGKLNNWSSNLVEGEIKEGGLMPQYTSRKSFYNKASVDDNDNTLVSYGTPIMRINDGKIEMLCKPEHLTQTTIRHIREFMQQNGMDPISKQELIKLINNKGINEAEDYDVDLQISSPVELNTGVLPIVDVDCYSRQELIWSEEESMNDVNGDGSKILEPGDEGYYEITTEMLDENIMAYAPSVIEEYICEVLPGSKVTPIKVYHPRQYNFGGDELEFKVDFDTAKYNEVENAVVRDGEFQEFLKNYSSHSGFISSMADNLDEFMQQDGWKRFVQVIMYCLRNQEDEMKNSEESMWEDIMMNI